MSDLSFAVTEQVPVGSIQILESPHVSEGPGRIAKAPVPSIYVDDRGDIHRLRVGGQRINLLFSKKGVMRSGYLHPHAMHDVVIRGQVEVWTLTNSGTQKTIYQEKQSFQIDPWTPHILFFLRDTILTEWWEADEFQCYYYHPYRKIIDVQNSLVAHEQQETGSGSGAGDDPLLHSHATGRYQRLIPQDEASLAAATGTLVGRLGTLLVVAAAAAAGVVVGITLGVAMGEPGGGGGGGGSGSREKQ